MPYIVIDSNGFTIGPPFDTIAAADDYAGTVAGATRHSHNFTTIPVHYRAGMWVTSESPPRILPTKPEVAGTVFVQHQRARLHQVWQRAQDPASPTGKQAYWPSLNTLTNSGTTIRNTLRPQWATDRWAYHQIAMGDVIAVGGGAGPFGGNEAVRLARIDHIIDTLETKWRVWYEAVSGNATRVGQWAGVGIGDGASLYSDIFEANGTAVAPDLDFRAFSEAIPDNFAPEFPTLRST